MRRQRNLHILPSCTHLKVSNLSSFAVSSKPSSSNPRANGHTSTKLHPTRSPLPSRTENGSKSILFRNFQTRAASTRTAQNTSEFDGLGIKYEEVFPKDPQRVRLRRPPNEVLAAPFLVRRGESPAAEQSVRERTIQLTPWRGTPTLLHALGFIQELEVKYGKIWWAGLSKEKANPYEYNPVIIVIFEDVASLSRIPGFTNPSPPELPKPLNPPEFMKNLNPNLVDLGPSPSLDPLDNPHSQALLKHVKAKSARNAFTAPLFVPWSESLNVAAYRQGGPSLEDILPFLGPKKAGELPVPVDAPARADEDQTGENSSSALAVQGPGEQSTFKRASWEEWDEAVSIDVVLRKYKNNTLHLPSPAAMASKSAQANPYFRPHIRSALAGAMVQFAGFSEQPTPSMTKVLNLWQNELDARTSSIWVPWNQPPSDSPDLAEDKEEKTVSDPLNSDDELPLDDLTPGVWPIVNPSSTDALQTGDELAPKKQQYQRIAEDDDGEDDDVDEWEGIGVHPLQHPRGLEPDSQGNTQADEIQHDLTATVRSRLSALPTVLAQLSRTSMPTEPPNNPPILVQIEKGAHPNGDSPSSSRKSRQSEDLRDTWRTDPRPFRSGLGGDEPSSYPPSTSAGRKSSGSRREQWSKPGLGSKSPETRERGAMANGSHSTPSEGWDKDRRGRKLRSREEVEMLKEFGLGNIDDLAAEQMERLRAARARGEFGKRETWQVREQGRERGSDLEEKEARISALAGQERRQKEVKNLKDRLRAILDGTKVD